MIEKLSPSFEMALQQELRDAYLKGVETGYRRAKEELRDSKEIDESQVVDSQ